MMRLANYLFSLTVVVSTMLSVVAAWHMDGKE
jgi:hypothetical protein